MYRWDPALAASRSRSIRTEDIREITINRPAASCLSHSLHCTLPAWLTCLNINPIVWRFRYRALTNPSSRPAFYLFWVVSKVDSGYWQLRERDGPAVVNLITYGQNVVINLSQSWSLSPVLQSPSILSSSIHDWKKTFLWQDIYINKSKILHR